MRYLTFFLAAVFIVSNAAAAARACRADLAGQEHIAARALDTEGDGQLCPQSDDARRCLTHCTQSYKYDGHKLSADFSAVAPPPFVEVFHVSFQAKPTVPALATAPPIVGPPLRILFLNFRN